MRYLSTLILVLLMLPTTTQACWYSSDTQVTYICPIDGVEILHTYYSDGAMDRSLDLQPLGGCRPLYERAQCPNDGMVMYKDNFTPEEVAILKGYLPTVEYQQMIKEDTTYWRVAKLEEKLGAPLYTRWNTLLQATWQASSDQYESYARETINVIEAWSTNLPKDKAEKGNETWQLLLGDLYRRVGDFDKAEAYFNNLLAKPAFKDHDSYLVIINYELELIAKKDQASHEKP